MRAAAAEAKKRPRGQAPRTAQRSRVRGAARQPTKVEAAHRVRLRPRLALTLTAALALLVIIAALAAGGRGAQAVSAARQGADEAERVAGRAPDVAAGLLGLLGWTVSEIHLQGASPTAQAEILSAAGVRPGQSLTGVDLQNIRDRVEQVGWVAHARVLRLLPDKLVISVEQRPLTAIWQHGGRSVVIASNGAPIPVVNPARFPSLPIVVGAGANTAAGDLLPVLHDHPRLLRNVVSLVRVDRRRWNLELKDDRRILLPEEGADQALARLDRIDRQTRVLDQSFEQIDLRDSKMIIVRPRSDTAPASAGGKST